MDYKAHIIELWNKGFTAGEIAIECDFTRSKVMGIVNRAKQKGLAVSKQPAPKAKKETYNPQRTFDFDFIDVPITPNHKTLLQLRMFDCRWIYDDGLYCGIPSEGTGSWCKEHHKIVFIPNSKRKLNATAV